MKLESGVAVLAHILWNIAHSCSTCSYFVEIESGVAVELESGVAYRRTSRAGHWLDSDICEAAARNASECL